LGLLLISANAVPTVVLHGINDRCKGSGLEEAAKKIANITGEYAECLEVGEGEISSDVFSIAV